MRAMKSTIGALAALWAVPSLAQTRPTLYPAAQTVDVTEGATDTAIKFRASTPAYDKPLFPDVQFDPAKLSQDGPIVMSAPNVYRAAFKSVATLPGGVTTGTVTFRMCRDSPCAHPWPGTEQVFTYTINVALKDWVTYQRDAGHSGYVHASYTGTFKKRWVWQPAGTGGMSAVATKGSSIFIVRGDYSSNSIVSLSMLGAPQWVYPIGTTAYVSAPAIADNKVFVPYMVMSSVTNPIVALDAATGNVALSNMTFASQWSPFTAPTPYGDALHLAAGYFGNEVTAYALASGETRWDSAGQGPWIYGGETPAVDAQHVYYYSGSSLDVFDRLTGTRVNSFADPYFSWGGYTYLGGPMLGTNGNVILQSGTGYYKPLVKFTSGGAATQLGTNSYVTAPAIAKGTIYSATLSQLDAVSEADGSILWSWMRPQDDYTYITGNIVATDTLILLSTGLKLYAISATDPAHPVVWSATTPGNIAISRDGLLLVTTTLNGSPALVAYSVK
ncbi:hypothetical protein GCM10009087_25580 [Sphingomonas oligophenolica]|uniref:Pyrrolo-quinoline quinone n=1 Tax=Sphingomonas oligophenolica TaxID=301154 RepID=A0ABU9Y886_9SPHN